VQKLAAGPAANASAMHKAVRSDALRKALVYQKKYLLLLVGDDMHTSPRYSPIRSYRYTAAMFPLPYKNVLKYRTRQNVGGISI
jgi:hypothetical protein